MQIPKQTIIDQATDRWTKPDLLARHSKKATKEFHIKLLSLFLLNSITTAFRTTIQNRASTLLRHDGQLLFWLICNHVHSSKNAFHKSIKDIIKTRSLSSDDKGNVETYVNFLRQQLTHLQSDDSDTSVNDVDGEGHMSNTTPLTPLQLLNKPDEKIQVLRCANKLTPKNDEPQIMALQSLLQEQTSKFVAAFSSISNSHSRPNHHHRTNSGTHQRGPLNNITWKHQPPTDLYKSVFTRTKNGVGALSATIATDYGSLPINHLNTMITYALALLARHPFYAPRLHHPIRCYAPPHPVPLRNSNTDLHLLPLLVPRLLILILSARNFVPR